MKIKMLFMLCLCTGMFAKVGLTQGTPSKKVYQVWLKSIQSKTSTTGYLWGLTDSTIILKKSLGRTDSNLKEFSVEDVKSVSYRDRKGIARGASLGALVGFAAGFIYGLLEGDKTCENTFVCIRFTPLQSGLVATPIGAIAGGILCSYKTSISIGQSRSEYARQRIALEKIRLRQ
jgi:hypothetical protein